jgi:hypothetical protein
MTSAFVTRQREMKIWGIKEALTDTRESHKGGSGLCRGDLEVTLRIDKTTSQEGASQNEEQV